jgi:AraC-like DNA-binding protein
MAILGYLMYILAMSATTGKPQIVYETSRECPLGRVVLSGLLRHHAGVPEKPMRILGNYALVYLLEGGGTFGDARGTRAELKPGDMWLIFPEIAHWYGPAANSLWDEFYIVFSGPLFDLWRAGGLFDPATPIRHLEPVDFWLRRLQAVAFAGMDSLQQVCSLQGFLAEVLQLPDGSRPPQWLDRACRLLQGGTESPEQVAQALGMSYEAFRKRFAAALNVSPGRYHKMKIMDTACALMAAGELSNKEIAERLHFCDEFHFSHRFRQITGLTPTQFRLKMPQPGRSVAQKDGRK